MTKTHRLVAIMFTDIVGYTTMMSKDEDEAFKCLEQNRLLHKSIIQEFNGEWLKEMGDGVLVSFNAASNAVFCAKKILETSHKEFDFTLRIGIHIGEVVFENSDIFGDGVNIASRIQSIAPEGCIYISESVLRNVENKKEIGTKYIGQKALKNVKHPIKIYQVKIEGKSYQEAVNDEVKVQETDSVNSMATLPFENMNTDADQESFISKINQFLDQNIENKNYGVSEITESLGISRSQLQRKLKSITGNSTSSYIREYKLKKGYAMLKDGVAKASEVSYKVGFSSPSYFNAAFSKFYGYAPDEAKFQAIDHIVAQKKSKAPLWMGLLILLVGLIAYSIYQTIPLEEFEGKMFFEKPKIKEKSIAVLAFEDLSEDQSQKFLGMGLAVEVINILDDVEGLKVIGKTSAFSFLDKKITIDSIAKLLNVNYVLEGTISESDGEKDIIAILTDGITGQTLFSQSYKMSKDDSSNIRSEIAKQVAYELKMKVNEDVILSSNRNDSRLLAMEQRAYYRTSKGATLREVIGIWDECLSLDSTYIPCIANRSRFANSPDDLLSYVNRLMELDSTNAYTYFVKGNYFFEANLDFQNAYLNYKKMLDKNPSDTRVLSEAAYRMGHFDIEKGLEYLHITMNKDPLYYKNYVHLASLYLLKGDYKKSIDLLYEMKTITGRSIPWQIIFINIYGGYYDEAEIALNEFISNSKGIESKEGLENVTHITAFFLSAAKKENLEFEKNLEKVIANGLSPFPIASALALYGDNDRSFEWLERGYETKNISWFYELKYAPWFEDMRSDPRWPALLNKLGMPGYEDNKIKS